MAPSVLTFEEVLDAVRAAGHTVFNRGDYNVNMVALRSPSTAINVFDDRMALAYRVSGQWKLDLFPCTTDPGRYHLQNPSNINGTAILIPGQYRSMYTTGLHGGKYPAICQRDDRPVKVWRDRNKDNTLDRGGKVFDAYGINVHRANAALPSQLVEKWSAGCMVIQDPRHFDQALRVFNMAVLNYGPFQTLTLLDWKSSF